MTDGASFETERHREDQPPREDLLDPTALDPEEVVDHDDDARRAARALADDEAGRMPDPEELPESQGADVVDAERLAEDATTRPPASDDLDARG